MKCSEMQRQDGSGAGWIARSDAITALRLRASPRLSTRIRPSDERNPTTGWNQAVAKTVPSRLKASRLEI